MKRGVNMREESSKWVSHMTGVSIVDEALAFKYFLKGVGVHEIESGDRILGWHWAEVRVVRPYPAYTDIEAVELERPVLQEADPFFEDDRNWAAYIDNLREGNKERRMFVEVAFYENDPRIESRDCSVAQEKSCHFEFQMTVSGHGGSVASYGEPQ